jgi:hypothetical protein
LSPPQIVDHLADGDFAHFDFEVPGAPHVAGDAQDAGAGVARGAELGVFVAARSMMCFTWQSDSTLLTIVGHR